MSRLFMVAALGLATALPAAAQFQKPEDAIKYRQAAFTLMGGHFGRLAGMAQGRIPFDAGQAAENAALVSTLAPLAKAGFGTGTDMGRPQRALPEVWSKPAEFKAAYDDMLAAVAKLDTAARSGSLDNLKGAVGEVGKSCKSCHDNFRAEKYSN